MAEKKLTAAQKKAAAQEAAAAAEAEAAAEAARKVTERKRLIGAGAVLAAVALFVGGFAVGKSSSNDDTLVGASVIQQDGPDGRRGPDADRPGRRGPDNRPDGRSPGGRDFPQGEGFEFPDGFEFPEGFEFPFDRDGFEPPEGFDFPHGFELPEGFEFPFEGGFEFGMECTADGECTFNMPEGFEFPGPDDRRFPGDSAPEDEQPAANAGYLGVSVIDNPDGVVVAQVSPGSPADEAGLEPGDRFVEVDGVSIDAVDDLVDVVFGSGSGTEVEVVVDRDGSALSFDVILGSPPA